jgi:hypothetical protein
LDQRFWRRQQHAIADCKIPAIRLGIGENMGLYHLSHLAFIYSFLGMYAATFLVFFVPVMARFLIFKQELDPIAE